MSSDIASLNRVFHRLALVDSSQKLTTVLDKLLPRLLKRIGDNHSGASPEKPAIHSKLIEILSHVLKRVRDDTDVKLPCRDLLQLLVVQQQEGDNGSGNPKPEAARNIHPLTFNLTLTFLGIGIQRYEEALSLLPELISLLEANHLTEQQDQLVAHLFFAAIEQETPGEKHESYMEIARSVAGNCTYSLFLDVLLYQPGPNPNLPSPGLSSASQSRLLSNSSWNQRWLSMKQKVLDMISPRNHLVPHNNAVVLLVVASSSVAQHDIAQRAQTYLKQLLEAAANRGNNDEDGTSSVATELLQLCIASTDGIPQKRRRPLDSNAAATVMGFCATSTTKHTTIAVEVAVSRLQEDDATIKRAASQLLRAVATSLDSTPLLSQCRDAAQSILETDTLLVVRDAAYGILATVARQLPMTDLTTAKLLFRCVAQEQERLRPRAVAALDAVSSSLQRHVKNRSATDPSNPWSRVEISHQPTDDRLGRALVPLLWTAAQSFQPKASRTAAAHWADELLRELALPSACHILCFLAGDPDSAAIAEESLTGKNDAVNPAFGDIAQMLFSPEPAPGRVKRYWDFSSAAKATCLRFALKCFLDDMYASDDRPLDLYLSALTKTLDESSISVDLLDACSECLLATVGTSGYARKQLLSPYSVFSLTRLEEMALTVGSSRARRHLAGSYGKLVEHTASERSDWAEHLLLNNTMNQCAAIVTGVDKSNVGRMHGAFFTSCRIIRASRLSAYPIEDTAFWASATTVISEAGKNLGESDEVLAHACADSLTIAFSYDGLDAPMLEDRLFESFGTLLENVTKCLKRFGHGDTMNATKVAKIIKTAGSCLAATTTASSDESIGTKRLDCVNALYELLGSAANRNDEEISMMVGDALSDFADGFSPQNAVWTHPGEWPEEFSDEFASQLPPHENVLFVLIRKVFSSSRPQTRTSCGPALLSVVARGVSKIRLDPSQPRCLALSLLHHLHSIQDVFVSLLSDTRSTQLSRESSCLGLAACRGLSEQAFLGSASGQEAMSTDQLNSRLLRAFGQTTQYGDSLFIETPAQAAARRAENTATSGGDQTAGVAPDREVGIGGAAGVSEASLGAFREMASASLALERPDVLYALMFLSVSHPFWFTDENKLRFSSSVLLGEEIGIGGETGAIELKQALRPHLGKLVPRILRACHDPNKQTREQMKALWEGLTGGGAEARSVISENLLVTIDCLIEEASNRLWRARAGACGALAETIVGREWDDLGGGDPVLNDEDLHEASRNQRSGGGRLLRIWRVAIRAVDDVHGSVQLNGETLARSVRGLTIRLCDPNLETKSAGEKRTREEAALRERSAASSTATCLWWLFRHGLTHKAQTVAGISISTIVGIVKVVRPRVIDPSLPELIRSLIMAMSGLEPAAFNYLQFHAENQEGLEALRLRMAQSGPLAEALNRCLELLIGARPQTQEKIAYCLNAALRQSAGFASRSAVADTVSSLCSVCPNVFLHAKNSSVQLLRAIYFASERERSGSAKSKMVHALGNLAALCSGGCVRSLALKACDKYTASTGNSFDALSRKTAASTLRAIAVRASDHFKDGGKGDIWRRKVLPVAFLGRKDDDEKVATSWVEVWEEGGASVLSSMRTSGQKSFGTTLEEQLLSSVVEECAAALQDVSWARRTTGATAIQDLVSQGILTPLPSSLGDSEDRGYRARKRAESSQFALCECIRLAKKPRLWNGKADVVTAMARLAAAWSSFGPSESMESLGWNGGLPDDCPWLPVSLSTDRDEGSLLVGDKWFENDSKGALVDMLSPPSPLVDDDPLPTRDNGTAMDFDECPDTLDEAPDMDELMPNRQDLTTSSVTLFSGLCQFLCEQAYFDRLPVADTTGAFLPYKASCLRGFKHLVSSLPSENVDARVVVYKLVSGRFVSLVNRAGNKDKELATPPLVVAGALDCIGVCLWKGMEGDDVKKTIELFIEAKNGAMKAWTVHEASCKGLSTLAKVCSGEAIRQHCWSTMVEEAQEALRDRKYWRVRLAGLQILESLVERAEEKKNQQNLVLEALLPQKEAMLSICRQCQKDNESKVKELASRVMHGMIWWP